MAGNKNNVSLWGENIKFCIVAGYFLTNTSGVAFVLILYTSNNFYHQER